MFTEHTTFRPRNGLSAEAYWRVRAWCEKNGFNFSDVLNAVIVPLAYYLENFCTVDIERSKATVILNVGELEILHVFKGKCYPLASTVEREGQDNQTLKTIQERLAHWRKKNENSSEYYDLIKPSTKSTNVKSKSKTKRNSS